MSYDILFVPRRRDQSWQDALDEAEGTDVVSAAVGPERLQQWDRVVDALRRRLGGLETSVADDVLEATHVESGLQVSLFPDEAAVTFPYWERADVARFHDMVVDVVGLVESETGLSAWDAQTDAPFDGTIHDEAGVSASRRLTQGGGTVPGPVPTGLDSSVPDVPPGPGAPTDGDTARPGPSAATAHPAPAGATAHAEPAGAGAHPVPARGQDAHVESAAERRRALRYLVVGLVVVLAALAWRSQGGASTLNGLAIAIGVADVVIGGLLWRSYRRRQREQR